MVHSKFLLIWAKSYKLEVIFLIPPLNNKSIELETYLRTINPPEIIGPGCTTTTNQNPGRTLVCTRASL